MAIGYSPSSIIGGPLDSRILEQLKAREEVYKSSPRVGGRTNNELLYLNSKTGWVKLSSSVNLLDPNNQKDEKGTSTLASTNVLFGGTYKENSTTTKSGIHGIGADVKRTDAAYQLYQSTGFRPMPGITEFSIKAKNRFGTLREAEVGFQVWSVEQLTEFESLYLRPGFTVLLEFGHSIYIKNKTGEDKPPKVVLSPPKTVSDYFTGGLNKNKIQDKIKDLKGKSNGNYDAIFGYIKNFSWSYRSDGGYDCRLTVIAAGELIESVTISMSPAEAGIEIDTNTGENYSTKSPMHIFFEAISEVPIGKSDTRTNEDINNDVNAKLEQKCPGLLASYKKFTGDEKFKILGYDLNSIEIEEDTGSESNSEAFRYVKMRDVLALLNAAYLLEDDKKDEDGKPLKLFEFNLEYDKSLFYTFPDHLAVDPGIAVLPKGTTVLESRLKYEISERLDVTVACTDEGNTQISDESILNIFLNVDFILSKLDAINAKSERQRTILAFIESILDTLTITMGNINDFGLHYEEDDYSFYLVDRKLTPNASDLLNSRINLTGLRATVSNVSLSSRLSPNIAKMIAVSAQAAGTDVGEDTEHMFRWNKGLRDRIVGSRKIPKVGTVDKKKKILDTAIAIGKVVGTFNIRRSYNPKDYDNLVNVHKELMLYLSQRYNKKSVRNGAPGIIPFDLNLTLDGLGGVKIGQAFTLNKGILPRKYDNMVAFLVTGVSHTVQNNKWNTDLKAQTIIIGKGDPLESDDTYETLTEDTLKRVLEFKKAEPDPTKPVKIINNVKDNGVPLFGSNTPIGSEVSVEFVLKNMVNQNPIVQAKYAALFARLLNQEEFGGYTIKINSAYRSAAASVAIFSKKGGAEPGKSAHNYACALDFNITDTNQVTFFRNDDPALWEITGIPQIAEELGLKWGGRFRLPNGEWDCVHFAIQDFDYKETFKEIINYLSARLDNRDLKDGLNTFEKQEITQALGDIATIPNNTKLKAFALTLSNPVKFGSDTTEFGKRLVPKGESARRPTGEEYQAYEIIERRKRGETADAAQIYGDGNTLANLYQGGSKI